MANEVSVNDLAAMLSSLSIREPADSKDIFPFFELPREIRDQIYGELLPSLQVPVGKIRNGGYGTDYKLMPCASMSSSMLIGMLMINRQFGAEYEEEASRHATTLSIDYYSLRQSLETGKCVGHPAFQRLAARVQILQLYVHPWEFVRDLWGGVEALSEFCKMLHGLHTLNIGFRDYMQTFDLSLTQDQRFLKQLSEISVRARLNRCDASILAKVSLKVDAKIKERLFSVNNNYEAPKLPNYELRSSTSWANYLHAKNQVIFCVTASKDPYAWNGLDLAVEESETFSLEDIEAEVELQKERAPKKPVYWTCGYSMFGPYWS